MAKNKNIGFIVLGLLIVGAFFFFKGSEEQALIPLNSVTIPRGVGYGDLKIFGDGIIDKVNSCEQLYGNCASSGSSSPLCCINKQNAPSLLKSFDSHVFLANAFEEGFPEGANDRGMRWENYVCVGESGSTCTNRPLDDYKFKYELDGNCLYNNFPDQIVNEIIEIDSTIGDSSNPCSNSNRLDVFLRFVENNIYNPTWNKPEFFEGQNHEITVTLNPSLEAQSINPVDGFGTYVAFAWIEKPLTGNFTFEQDATRRFGKAVDFVDLSKEIQVDNSPTQPFLFSFGQLPIGKYDFYVIFTKQDENDFAKFYKITDLVHIPFLVNPKAMTVGVFSGASCPAGYQFQNPSGELIIPEDPNSDGLCEPLNGMQSCTCVRDDLSSLFCVKLGCPITLDPSDPTGATLLPYSCGSDGFCSEVVSFDTKCTIDSDCGPTFKCEPTSGRCYNEQIVTELIQCQGTDLSQCQDLNCQDSNGTDVVATGCSVDGFCEYSGQCDVQLDNCAALRCPTDFVCMSDGNCQRTITETIEKNVTVFKNVTIEKEVVKEPEGPFGLSTTALAIIAVLVVLFLLNNKKGRI